MPCSIGKNGANTADWLFLPVYTPHYYCQYKEGGHGLRSLVIRELRWSSGANLGRKCPFCHHHWDSDPQLSECKSCILTTKPWLLPIESIVGPIFFEDWMERPQILPLSWTMSSEKHDEELSPLTMSITVLFLNRVMIALVAAKCQYDTVFTPVKIPISKRWLAG